ncbi:MAG TPA: hypothetical protein VHM91_15545 [Verrucomicrobiales bacterium]|jgi:uncharacterized protein Yka (UPF0111/DUF47 family)|nr:hypothetical protein [Verrucomicrobiales bacterium]
MFSLQRLLGRPREFFGLLEQSAALGAESVNALRSTLANRTEPPQLDAFVNARRQDKAVINRLEEMLTKVFVTPIEREDLQAVATQLYRLPKTVEKFAERYVIVWEKTADFDFSLAAHMLESGARIVVEMVQLLSKGGKLAEIKAMDARLSQIESDAGRVILEALRRTYEPGGDALSKIIAQDLYHILSDCIDVCRSIGRTLALVILKNS